MAATMSNVKETMEIWDVSALVPYAENAKVHDPKQVTALTRLIKQYGWTQPIVVQRGTGSIIAGHGRRLAAIEMGLKKVPVCVVDVSDDEARLMRLADNRVASTDYDATKIQSEIFDLKDLGLDISLMNFNDKELAFLTEDIAELDMSAFVDDISDAVEVQKTDNAAKEREIGASDSPLSKAFGFKRLNISEGRKVKAFMTALEVKFGKTGAAALIDHIDSYELVSTVNDDL